jgi:hypothetical protein
MLEITKGVPIPPSRGGVRGSRYQELGLMEVGDSIFPPLNGEEGAAAQSRIASACQYLGRKAGKRFTTRIFEDCIGVWRIEDDPYFELKTQTEPVPTPATDTQKPAALRPPQPVVVALKRTRGRPRKIVVNMENGRRA